MECSNRSCPEESRHIKEVCLVIYSHTYTWICVYVIYHKLEPSSWPTAVHEVIIQLLSRKTVHWRVKEHRPYKSPQFLCNKLPKSIPLLNKQQYILQWNVRLNFSAMMHLFFDCSLPDIYHQYGARLTLIFVSTILFERRVLNAWHLSKPGTTKTRGAKAQRNRMTNFKRDFP